MIKKIAGFALAITLLSSVPVFASTRSEKALEAAPAIAAELLIDHGVQPTGEVLQMVASHMGPAATFMGISKNDPMYRHKVMHYLHCTLGVIEMEHADCIHHGMAE